MTYTQEQAQRRPDVAAKRHARSVILEAVYGPNVQHATVGGVPFGLRDSTQRAGFSARLGIVQQYWRDAQWPEDKLDMILRDAGIRWEDI